MNAPASAESTTAATPCKAMLLAAGRGERMRPLTDSTAKPLLKVAGKRLIDYHLEKLAGAGVTQVVVNTSWQAEKIESTLGDGSSYGLHIDYSYEPVALETAGGIRQALPLLGDNPFLVVSTDVWCDIDYADFIAKSPDSSAHLLMVNNPAHHPEGDFTIAPGGKVQIKNDIGKFDSEAFTYSGIGLYHPQLFKSLPVAPLPLRDVLIPTIKAGQTSASVYDGLWFDIGTVERLKALNDYLVNRNT